MSQKQIITEVTGLYPVPVWAVSTPVTIEDVIHAVKNSSGPISIGGGRFSMGGQTASPGSLHLDMRKLNNVLNFSPIYRTIHVQTGIRWCDLQRFLDPHNLSVKIMQTYANFTVGGSLSVNVHGRYIGQGPLVLSVNFIRIILANGKLVQASPTENSEIFYGAIGGYGGLGVIVEAELSLADNTRLERVALKLPTNKYYDHFKKMIHDPRTPVFHNADLYPPHYKKARSVTWFVTNKPVTEPHRLKPVIKRYPLERYFYWAISETPTGKWRREYIVDPLLYSKTKVHWRNYEAGYDVAELEPASRKRSTYVLQEYFVPVEKFDEFVPVMGEILQRHNVNMINISIRHAMPDPGTYLAWAKKEVFAFVLYYKQRTNEAAKNHVAVWTRELIEAAINHDGCYYLPYQAHATPAQFHRAYPEARKLFDLKNKLDPDFRFRNVIWDNYYKPVMESEHMNNNDTSDFHIVYDDINLQDNFFKFLQNIYRIYPEDSFHTLIKEACSKHGNDEIIYRYIQERLPNIKPFLADLFYALPALKKQKQEMTRQTLKLLNGKKFFDGYVEIGSTGRYISDLKNHIDISGPIYLVNDFAPTNSPIDIVERGQLGKIGTFIPMNNYEPINDIHDNSVDLVTCYIGLHHSPLERLDGFVKSINRILKQNGTLILRDHNVTTPEMNAFVSLAHAVFNAGLGLPWQNNAEELRFFKPIYEWSNYLQARGFKDSGSRLLQQNDPTDNMLLAFTKTSSI